MKFLLLFAFLAISTSCIDGARILCYLQSPGKSHVLLALPICEELAARGHQVLTLTNYKFGKDTANFTNVVVPVDSFSDELKELMASGQFSFKFMKIASQYFRKTAIDTLESELVREMMKSAKFDLIIFLSVMLNDVQLGLADHFKVPYVALSPMGNMLLNRQHVGSHSLPATVSSQMLGINGTMNFWQRVKNFLMNIYEYIMAFIINYMNQADYEKFWPSDRYRSYDEMKRNISLIFLNGHHSDSGVIRPLLPTEIEVGGIQIKTKPTPLTGDLKKFLDEATEGAILWTFGSNVEVSGVEPEKIDIMLKVLSKLKHRIVLKWEIDDKSRLPKNVFAQKWLPQDSILAHPNVKLFIGHGGAGGLGEAKYHQVPLLASPFFADQMRNSEKIEEDGWGRAFKVSEVTEESFTEMVNDMLTNQKYRETVKALSDKYRDRVSSALDTAVFWVEYVLKHHGAPHLQYSGKDLNFFQRHSFDVLAFFAAILWISWKLLKFSVKFCCSKCCKSKTQTSKKLKNKKKQN
ncbi:UDP-glycosyltransferase UGT5-like [Culicoides brevitarsis]|uniref:UDP-glycosyltransferase UGT5-like n=1 Tax=Culicoides brevitarsis TaxID=469753 RepID=UPI00307C9ABC